MYPNQYPNPETSLTLGMPRAYPIAQYTAYSLERLPYSPETSGGCPMALRLPYSQETAPTVSPVYPSFRNRHTHGTQHTQHSRRPQGPDYKTTRLHCQPTESIMPRAGKIQRKPDRGKYREIAQRRQIQRKAYQRQPTEAKLAKLQGMSTEAWCNKPHFKLH